MTQRAFRKIESGLKNAIEYARLERAIHDWIRDDVPLTIQMTITPEHVSALVDRIAGSKTTTVTVKSP